MIQNLKGTNLFSQKKKKKKKKIWKGKKQKNKKAHNLSQKAQKEKRKNILFKATRIRNWNEVDWFWTKWAHRSPY